MKPLELLPAVDVREGQAVRLVQGELSAQSNYGAPLEAALDFQNAGRSDTFGRSRCSIWFGF